MFSRQVRFLVIISLICTSFIGCRGVDQNNGGGSTGELTLGITDGPVENADELRIVFSGVEITPTGGSPILIENLNEDTVDFLDMAGDERELLLRRYDLADGTYDTLRLIIDEASSYIQVNGSQFPLSIPAAEMNNLILDVNVFLDEDNDLEDLTIDLDLRKSIRVDETVSPFEYSLHPRLRVVETDRSETLRGSVHEDLITDSGCANENNHEDGNAVYLYVGNSGNLLDIQNDGNDPSDLFATAKVDYNNSSNEWEFTFGFLPRQAYRVAFTCDAILDNPDSDDTGIIDYEGPITIDVQQGNTDTVRFDP